MSEMTDGFQGRIGKHEPEGSSDAHLLPKEGG